MINLGYNIKHHWCINAPTLHQYVKAVCLITVCFSCSGTIHGWWLRTLHIPITALGSFFLVFILQNWRDLLPRLLLHIRSAYWQKTSEMQVSDWTILIPVLMTSLWVLMDVAVPLSVVPRLSCQPVFLEPPHYYMHPPLMSHKFTHLLSVNFTHRSKFHPYQTKASSRQEPWMLSPNLSPHQVLNPVQSIRSKKNSVISSHPDNPRPQPARDRRQGRVTRTLLTHRTSKT